MENLVKDCPFQFDITPFDPSYCLREVLPFKNLYDVSEFLHFLAAGNTLPWLENVLGLVPATDYCYYNSVAQVDQEYWYPKPRFDRSSVAKNLFCHDYRGGYLEDRFINGSIKHDSYIFFNWSSVDIFVYFSHHFITIPPPAWVNAAHRHGVPILGTLITEWTEGQLIWEQILESNEKTKWFARVLSLLATVYKFDGYLLNIENAISVDMMPRLMMFIKSLKDQLTKSIVTKSYVIWYDSITITGELKWQNELNYNNKPFFDVTDGIFLNYTWNEGNLDRSKKMAGERLYDVYVGVDVFGRNMFGGGGFNTASALKKVRERDLSAAIFAFAWTEEVLPGDFHINDRIFWSKLMPLLFTHGTKQLPFSTDFNRGYGLKYYKNGFAKGTSPWFDMSKQNFQYSYLKCQNPENDVVDADIVTTITEIRSLLKQKDALMDPEKVKQFDLLNSRLNELYALIKPTIVEYVLHDGFNGGGCLRIGPNSQEGTRHICLFDCDLLLKNEWSVVTVMKSESEKQVADAEFYPIVYVVLETWEKILHKIELRHGNVTEELPANWIRRKFKLAEKGRILEIGVLVMPNHKEILLGELHISDEKWNTNVDLSIGSNVVS